MTQSVRLYAVVGGVALLAGFGLRSGAATIHVPAGQPTIQAGLDAASAGDTVLVACGTYYEHEIDMKPGVCLRSGTGLADCVNIDGGGHGSVILCSGDSLAAVVGFTLTGGDSSRGGGLYCSWSSLAVTSCVFTGNTAEHGGGVYCSGSSLTLTDVAFTDNLSGFGGGGLDCDSSSPTLVGCVFFGNTAFYGGGMYCGYSTPSLTDCTFSSNGAHGQAALGGGVYVWECPSVEITACQFLGNPAGSAGGGMYGKGSEVTLSDCTFAENVTYSCGGNRLGGAGAYFNECSPTLYNCSFLENYTYDYGGGAYFRFGSAPVLTDCWFSGNGAYLNGGGVYLWYTSPAAFANCSFSANVANGEGGAIRMEALPSATLTNCTLSGNAAESGGGMYCRTSPTSITNSIIALGSAGEAICAGPWSPVTTSCCDIYGNAGGDWIGCVAGQLGVNGNICEDPLFCLDGNPDAPYTLHENSPCAAENNPGCGRIGAWDVGCEAVTPVQATSWGAVKAMFR